MNPLHPLRRALARLIPGGAVTGWHRHRHRPGLTIPADTTNEGWGLLHGHQRGPRPGHTRGLSHGHGHPPIPTASPHSAMSASFDGNGSPPRVFGDARRGADARGLCDQARGRERPRGPTPVAAATSPEWSRSPAGIAPDARDLAGNLSMSAPASSGSSQRKNRGEPARHASSYKREGILASRSGAMRARYGKAGR